MVNDIGNPGLQSPDDHFNTSPVAPAGNLKVCDVPVLNHDGVVPEVA